MDKFRLKITETIVTHVTIEADDADDAREKLEKQLEDYDVRYLKSDAKMEAREDYYTWEVDNL